MGGTHDGVPIFILYNDSIHESWWMDFLSQINHAFNSSDFKIPYFIAQWSQKNLWNRQFPFPQWFYDFFLRQFGQFLSMKVVNQLPSNKMLINILQRYCSVVQSNKINVYFVPFFVFCQFWWRSYENTKILRT